MILGLNHRRPPLDGVTSRLGRVWRLTLGFCVSVFLLMVALSMFEEASDPGPKPNPRGTQQLRFVSRSTTSVYREPYQTSGVVTRLKRGKTVGVIKTLDDWALVDTEAGPGWVEMRRPARSTQWIWTVRKNNSPGVSSINSSDPPGESDPSIILGPEAAATVESETPLVQPTPIPVAVAQAQMAQSSRENSRAVAWAKEKMAHGGMQMLESENFRLWTDIQDPARIGMILGLAEQTRRRFHELFEPHFELSQLEGRSEIFLFRRREDYLEFYQWFKMFPTAMPSGHYSPDLRTIALSEESIPGNSMAATFVHEMVHLLLDQSLYGLDVEPQAWLGEGLACVFAYTAGSEPERIALIQSRQDRFGVGLAARARLQNVQIRMREGLALRFRELVQGEESFRGPEGARYYDAAWLLCHYLLYADSGKHRTLLIEALDADRQGRNPEPILEKIALLESSFVQFIKHPSRR